MRTAATTTLMLVLVVVLATGCTQVVPGRAAAAPPATVSNAAADPPITLGTDELATATVEAVQEYWRAAFPAAFGQEWRDIAAFVPVDTADPGASPPPCVRDAADVVGQAFYCPSADAVAWDADGLLPELRERFGPSGVVVVLSHEIGHAVQARLGVDRAQAADPAAYPTILLEAMADCYAGVALAHLAQLPVAGLPAGPAERDKALLALVGFSDPLGVVAGDRRAHGNAFDRVSAFQDGYLDGPARCADMSLENRTFTQRRFGSAADQARGGDLALPQLLAAVEVDAREWFTGLGAARRPGWTAPPLRSADSVPEPCSPAQGPVSFCLDEPSTDGGAVVVDLTALDPLHRRLGDYAGATLVASRYGLAVLNVAGGDIGEPAAGTAAVCLAGAYTARLIDPAGSFTLSPGDLDEAVQVLIDGDLAARNADGMADPTAYGFERVGWFRTGFRGGPDGCLP